MNRKPIYFFEIFGFYAGSVIQFQAKPYAFILGSFLTRFQFFVSVRIPPIKGWIITLYSNLRKGILRNLFRNTNLEIVLFIT